MGVIINLDRGVGMYYELIDALRICSSQPCCDNCPRYDKDPAQETDDCSVHLLTDAADALEAADKRIAELEAQKPKEGEWRWLSSTYDRVPCEMRYWCSVCHHEEITHNDKPWKRYCPNCGARMREGVLL